jgi:POT family proton-dependent oligopeptide transporter
MLIPVLSFWVYPAAERMGVRVTPLRKMGVGMALAAVCFAVVGMIQSALDSGRHISVAWQFIPYFIITLSEVMISITALEFAYSQAPRAMKSSIMSLLFLTIFAGNFLTAFISKINIFQGASYFYFFAGLMAVVSVGFIMIAARYRVRDYFENPVSAGA